MYDISVYGLCTSRVVEASRVSSKGGIEGECSPQTAPQNIGPLMFPPTGRPKTKIPEGLAIIIIINYEALWDLGIHVADLFKYVACQMTLRQ